MVERDVDMAAATAVVDVSARPEVDGVLLRVRSLLPEFTGALQRVAEQVLTDPAGAARATIVELAERSGTSPATVTRFCRALGFDGLRRPAAGHRRRDRPRPPRRLDRRHRPRDPAHRPARPGARPDHGRRHPGDARHRLAARPRRGGAGRRRDRRARAGSTSSAPAAARWSARRCSSASTASASPRGPGPTCTTAWPAPRCCAPATSRWASRTAAPTRETIEMLAEAGSRGATTIALTSFPRSPLAELADIVLLTATQATTFRPDALSARHPQLVVLDLLYIAVAQRTHDRAHAAFQRTAQAVDGHKAAKAPHERRSERMHRDASRAARERYAQRYADAVRPLLDRVLAAGGAGALGPRRRPDRGQPARRRHPAGVRRRPLRVVRGGARRPRRRPRADQPARLRDLVLHGDAPRRLLDDTQLERDPSIAHRIYALAAPQPQRRVRGGVPVRHQRLGRRAGGAGQGARSSPDRGHLGGAHGPGGPPPPVRSAARRSRRRRAGQRRAVRRRTAAAATAAARSVRSRRSPPRCWRSC